MLEMKSIVSKVLRHFSVSLAPHFKLTLAAEVILRPSSGMHLKLAERIYHEL